MKRNTEVAILSIAMLWVGFVGYSLEQWKRKTTDAEKQKDTIIAKMNWVLGQERKKIVPWSQCNILIVWEKTKQQITTVLQCSDDTHQAVIMSNTSTEEFWTVITYIATDSRWKLDSRWACLRMKAENPDNPNWDARYVISDACITI